MNMFVVVVTHDTGHGKSSCPVLATRSIRKAVETARGVEGLGYEFYGNETGVGVCRLEQGRSYHRDSFKWLEGGNPPPTVIFYRHHLVDYFLGFDESGRPHHHTFWKEEWLNKKIKTEVDKKRRKNWHRTKKMKTMKELEKQLK
jgi:hypothetical protein